MPLKNWRKIQKTQGKTKNSSKKLKTQGKNSRPGRIFPRLASQVVLKKKPAIDTTTIALATILPEITRLKTIFIYYKWLILHLDVRVWHWSWLWLTRLPVETTWCTDWHGPEALADAVDAGLLLFVCVRLSELGLLRNRSRRNCELPPASLDSSRKQTS